MQNCKILFYLNFVNMFTQYFLQLCNFTYQYKQIYKVCVESYKIHFMLKLNRLWGQINLKTLIFINFSHSYIQSVHREFIYRE